MVDEARVLRLLRGVTDDLSILRRESTAGEERRADPIWLLGSHDVLPADLASALRKAVGFRKLLVHDYIQVSDDIVITRLDDLTDIERFVEGVVVFITGGGAA